LPLILYPYLAGITASISEPIVLSAFKDAKIPVIVLKGWALIQSIYGGDYGQRNYSDIDLLISPEDADASEAILRSLGWNGGEERRPGYSRRYLNARAYFFEEQVEMLRYHYSIGLHWGLLHHPSFNPEQISIESIFKNAHQLAIAGVSVLEMSVEDHLVYNCAHIVLQHRSEEILLPYYEIALVVGHASLNLDWQKMVDRAIVWKLVMPLKIVLKKVQEFWPEVLPVLALNIIQDIKPAISEKFIHLWYQKTNYNVSLEHFLTWFTMSGIKRRFYFILEDIFLSKDKMIKYFGPASFGFWPILYINRFLRIFASFLKK